MLRPPTQHRYRGSGPFRYPSARGVTCAATFDAFDTTDAMSKLRVSAAGRHLNNEASPVSRRDRVFLGAAEPLYDIKDPCEQQNTEQLARLHSQMVEHRQELDRQQSQLEEERELLNRKFDAWIYQKDLQIDQLRRDTSLLQRTPTQHRYRTSGPFRYPSARRVTYATTFNAVDTPDAMSKL